jgi:hypothetical protein
MRYNFRVVVAGVTFFVMIAKTQTLEGITSLQRDGKHIVMWDLENCTLRQIKKLLKKIQKNYGLSDIKVVTDNDKTYRAWCFSKVDFIILLKILVDSLSILDYNFFYYTVKRRKATLRTGTKKGRSAQRVVCVLKSHSCSIDCDVVGERVVYDTGLEKRGRSILLGGEKDGQVS